MRTPSPLPSELSDRPFAVGEARSAGVSESRLRRSDLAAPFRGVRCPADDPAVGDADADAAAESLWERLHAIALARIRAFAVLVDEGVAVSHLSAAIVHGLPVPARLLHDPLVHVAVTTQARRRRRNGVVFHLVVPKRQRSQISDGIQVISAVDTWCMMAAELTLTELVVMGDALVCRKHPPATMDELSQAVHGFAGRPGAKKLRAALALVRPRTDSPAETELRLAILAAGLPEPEINVWVVDRKGRRLRLGDLVYVAERILIEYDGPHHFADPAQQRKDIDALDAAAADGWRVIRVHVGHRRAGFRPAVARIRAALASA
ncbi:hypothetical protein [Microbacterium gilvum]|uniref:DUF559 domain-containing protein n=1 Tax=Microbacterium gilvum TaxID=1336204 RepID=A0ABP9AE61_9MICO